MRLNRDFLLRLCRCHVGLLEQLRQFPLGAHDDGPDALVMVVSLSTIPGVSLEVVSLDIDDDEDWDDEGWQSIDTFWQR